MGEGRTPTGKLGCTRTPSFLLPSNELPGPKRQSVSGAKAEKLHSEKQVMGLGM